jgi:hypothetical protein
MSKIIVMLMKGDLHWQPASGTELSWHGSESSINDKT